MSARRGSFSTYRSRPPPPKQDAVVPFPAFDAIWTQWDMKDDVHQSTNQSNNSSTNESSKQSNSQSVTKQSNKSTKDRNLGTLLFAGGGGKAGTGVSSGIILTHVTEIDESANPSVSQSKKPSSKKQSSKVCEVTPFARFDTHDALITAVKQHPMFDEIAVGAGDVASVIHFNPATNSSIDQSPSLAEVSSIRADFSIKEPSVEALAISSDGLFLAVGGADRVIRIYRYAPQLTLIGLCGSINPSKLQTVDYTDQQSIKQSFNIKEQHSDCTNSLCFNQNTRVLASCAGDGSCKIWDVSALITKIKTVKTDQPSDDDQSNNRIDTEESASQPISRSTNQSDDSSSVEQLMLFPLVGSVTVPLKKGQFAKFQACHFTGGLRLDEPNVIARLERLLCIVNISARDSHSTRLVEAQLSRIVRTANIQTTNQSSTEPMQIQSRVLRSVPVSSERLVKMSVSGDGRFIAISDCEGSVFVFDSDDFEMYHRHLNIHSMPATALPFAPSNDWLCSVSADRTFRFFDLRAPSIEQTKQEHVINMLMRALALLVLIIAVLLAMYFQPQIDDAYRAGEEMWKRYM